MISSVKVTLTGYLQISNLTMIIDNVKNIRQMGKIQAYS